MVIYIANFKLGVTTLTNSGILSLAADNGVDYANGTISLDSYVIYQQQETQNLTAQQVTSLTPLVLTGGTLSITATVTGNISVDAWVRGSNDVLGDGVEIGIYNGTTLLDSEVYTQEGAVNNSHTFMLHYLDSIALNTATEYSIQGNVITGGTISLKIVSFKVGETS
ncbi:MAG: hypothetical protein ACYDAO_04510 [Thermoplasmataceae archaeon]